MKNCFKKVVELLRIEAAAIERAAGQLDRDSVETAIELILQCKGKIIVIGVGKSGVIAQKISQTLTSTGTVAVFVHPSDALHGSLGIITKGDVVIALSNSGETDEILALLPTLKNRGIELVSIVGKTNSSLARQSDIFLDASVDKEACPLNLAPTTSTTVALSIGDALAMTLMRSKGLTEEDFAENHPAGRLGKRLTIKVANLMHDSPNISGDRDWFEILKTMSRYSLGAATIIDENMKLMGIITEGDLRRTIEKTSPEALSEMTAEKMMTRDPTIASPNMLAYDALKLMEERPRQISVLPVVDNEGTCIGLIRLHDIVRSGL